MATNANTEYELFVRDIYDALHKAEGLNNVQVLHDVRLLGRSGLTHQLDVYWQFEMAGITHQVGVDCKNYRGRVKVGQVRDFRTVIEEVGPIKGIMVTTIGFQRGAKELADSYNISLHIVRAPAVSDFPPTALWKVDVKLHATLPPRVKAILVYPDRAWLQAVGLANPEQGKIFTFTLRPTEFGEMLIYDEQGHRTGDFETLARQIPYGLTPGSTTDLVRGFDVPGSYVDTDKGRIKVIRVEFVYDLHVACETASVSGTEAGRAIIKDVMTGKARLLDRYGQVTIVG